MASYTNCSISCVFYEINVNRPEFYFQIIRRNWNPNLKIDDMNHGPPELFSSTDSEDEDGLMYGGDYDDVSNEKLQNTF